MLFDGLCQLILSQWPVVVLLAVAVYLARNKFYHGLQKYPGPLVAAYTDWWRFCENWSQDTHNTHQRLHKKYGDVVRLGPNSLSFAEPKALKTIYALNKGMTKSEFYPIQQPVAQGRRVHSLFSTTDEEYHAQYRRCINGAFAMSNLVSYEPLVDSTTDAFIDETRKRYCGTDKDCDFYKWLQFFALDVIGELTWSKRIGFIDEGRDVGGVMQFIGKSLAYAGPVGQMPWLDLVWDKNPLRLQLQRWGWGRKAFPVTAFAIEQNQSRAGELEKIKREGSVAVTSRQTQGVDLLMKFAQAQHDHPNLMTDGQVIATCNSMITAGSETTAISLSAIFQNLMQNKSVYHTLMAEIEGAATSGAIAERRNHKVSWAEAQRLPYLDAVIQESFRLHPAAGLTLERIVPVQGMEIAGRQIPGGTIVGCNPWVLHRRPEVFGSDVDTFRPERWLEAPPDQLREMKATMFQFGGGSRTCIGKHISLFEIYKIVPTFLRNFDFRMTRHDEHRLQCVWMVRHLGFYTKLSQRPEASV